MGDHGAGGGWNRRAAGFRPGPEMGTSADVARSDPRMQSKEMVETAEDGRRRARRAGSEVGRDGTTASARRSFWFSGHPCGRSSFRSTPPRGGQPEEMSMRLDELSGPAAAVYRAVAEREGHAGAPHLQDTAAKPNTSIVTGPSFGRRDRQAAAGQGVPKCGHCHQPLPWMAEAGNDDFAAAAEQASMPLSQRFAVHAVPPLLVVRGGGVLAQQAGPALEPALRSWVDRVLSGRGE